MNPKLVNILPVFLLAAEMGNVGDQMGRTKGPGKYILLGQCFDEVAAMGTVDFTKVLSDAKALEKADRAELVQLIDEKLKLGDAKIEAAIEEGLGIVVDAYSLFERAKSMYAAFSA